MLPQLPFEQPDPLAFPPRLRRLALEGPVHRVRTRVGDGAWLVTGYDEVRALLADDRLGRSHPEPARAARAGESVLFGGPQGDHDTEEADHNRMRSLMRPHFTPRRMRALVPRVEELTTTLLEDLERRPRPADLNAALAVPLPILVICELLGVPYADRDRFRAWALDAADATDRSRSERGMAALFSYGLELVARKRRRPGEDVLSRLVETPDVGDEEAAMIAMALLFAGHETTVVRIGLGVLCLLAEPDRYQALVRDPGRVPAVVEEILRLPGGGSGGIPRYARTDIEIAGVTIRAGDLVMCDTGAANHDPGAFAEPDRFDPGRTGPSHLGFGHGARYCVGAPLARIELGAVLSQLTSRLPTLRLAAGMDGLRVREQVITGGLRDLPVEW
ncbi:pentalenolactone synthase [Nocardiopsis arvandica]|uniref:Pentalenolactone synthase n=1 Tax=Nocardiopsis sinuspersici TaxID=501010 RepID=A0A7Y9XAL2_9ACTN|nr:cytochrome P450 [Nocardiopsis sinuspersici]NYH51462.1 pentalenolactone synthase [Nocardiopsis sinuspersici]